MLHPLGTITSRRYVLTQFHLCEEKVYLGQGQKLGKWLKSKSNVLPRTRSQDHLAFAADNLNCLGKLKNALVASNAREEIANYFSSDQNKRRSSIKY